MAKKKPDRLDELLKGQSPAQIQSERGALKELKKRLVEKALEGEPTEHLVCEKSSPTGRGNGNSRNGKTSKSILDGEGTRQVDVPAIASATSSPS